MSIFTDVKRAKIKRSTFNLSEESKLSCNFGQLIPILCKEVLPNDTFKIDTELLIKLAPLKAPVMHRIKAKVDYFFVPNYQICSAFEDFINPKVNTPGNPIVLPYVDVGTIRHLGSDIGSLCDYMGLPIKNNYWLSGEGNVSLLPFMAYQHIYNSYYRDQNLQPFVTSGTGIYENVSWKDKTGEIEYLPNLNLLKSLLTLRSSAWKKDYFTSALPSPQAGDDVKIPIGGTLPVSGTITTDAFELSDPSMVFPETTSQSRNLITVGYVSDKEKTIGSSNDGGTYQANSIKGSIDLNVGDGLIADASEASMISINDLRKLFSLQKFKELAERGGTRYTEVVRNFFGAFLPDIYFDRPLYLGGQVQPISIGEVVSTTSNPSDTGGANLGYRGGIGNSYGRTRSVKYHSNTHGFIMGILRILPEATYSQGVERMWTRQNIFDYAFPQFANLGEQEIYNREIYAQGTSDDSGVFGYTPRYAEYKEGHCHIAGDFRDTLKYWHFGREFANLPTLSSQFVASGMDNYNPFAVTDSTVHHCYVNLYNHIIAKRPLPYFGTPVGL